MDLTGKHRNRTNLSWRTKLTTLEPILFLLGSYLFGSIPTAYLTVRLLKGADVRDYGSGSVGGSNAGTATSRWMIVPVGIIDIIKGAIPTLLALEVLDLGLAAAVAAGLMATMGHNWSIFLGFTGGRGLSTMAGTLLVVFPQGALFLFICIIVSFLLGSTAGSTIGLLGLPLVSIFLDQPTAITWGCMAMILITFLKRLEANRRPLPEGDERWPTIWRRLWLDRDIADHQKWLSQRPPETQP